MTPSARAFRFTAVDRFAIDIQNDTVVLLVDRNESWSVVPEFPRISATAEDIAAGGAVKFIDLILELINPLLRLLQGKPRAEDITPAVTPQDEVLMLLKTGVVTHTLMDGTIQLRRKP